MYDECSSLETLWERLRNRFGEHLLKQQYRRLLPNRKRQNGETLTQLVDDIRKMSDAVYCHIDRAAREEMAVQHFVAALDSPSIQYDLDIQHPKSLYDAMHLAIMRESYFGKESAWSKAPQGQNWGQNKAPNGKANEVIGQLHGPNSLSAPQMPSHGFLPPQGAYSIPAHGNGWNLPHLVLGACLTWDGMGRS